MGPIPWEKYSAAAPEPQETHDLTFCHKNPSFRHNGLPISEASAHQAQICYRLDRTLHQPPGDALPPVFRINQHHAYPRKPVAVIDHGGSADDLVFIFGYKTALRGVFEKNSQSASTLIPASLIFERHRAGEILT
ncbi:MAG: hypothetical protein R3C61_11965 [Bacteroidia bacterium]